MFMKHSTFMNYCIVSAAHNTEKHLTIQQVQVSKVRIYLAHLHGNLYRIYETISDTLPEKIPQSNCMRKRFSKPHKDVSNKTKSYQGPNFEFYFKNLDCFNKHFDVSTLSCYPNISSKWSTTNGLLFLYIYLFALLSAPGRSHIVNFGQRFYKTKILYELNQTIIFCDEYVTENLTSFQQFETLICNVVDNTSDQK